MAEQLVLRDW